MEYDNARILITDQKLESIKDVMGILEAAAKGGGPLVIIAEDVTVGFSSMLDLSTGCCGLRDPHDIQEAACTSFLVSQSRAAS